MKLHLGYLLGFSAISLAGCAGFFSIVGLSQLFAGSSTAVIVMATALEFSKIIIASYLHSYWGSISKIMRTYFVLGVGVLVLITSAGIYGFLSNAFQKTANDIEIQDGEVGIIDSKIAQFQVKVDANNKIIEMKTKRLTQLSDLRSIQENRLDNSKNSNSVRKDIVSSSNEVKTLNSEIDILNDVNSKLTDSIGKYSGEKIVLKNKSTATGEVGPLKYMAELTGVKMNKIVNYFILLLVFVFDPLAVCLVIATTSVFKKHETPENHNNATQDDIVAPIIESTDNDEIIEEMTPNEIIPDKVSEVSPDNSQIGHKIKREDIKEVKELMNRGFSVGIPKTPKQDNVIFGKNGRIK